MVLGEYTPPAAAAAATASKAACCADCASPADRRRNLRRGAGLVLGVAGRARGQLAGSSGEEDPLIWWPSDIKALLERTNTEVWTNARDYSEAIKSGAINGGQLAAFKDFFNEWDRFYKGIGWFAGISGGTAMTAKNYRVRNAQFRQVLSSAGVNPSSPAPSGLPTKPVDWEGLTKWVVGGAVVVGGAIALGNVGRIVSAFKAPARSAP